MRVSNKFLSFVVITLLSLVTVRDIGSCKCPLVDGQVVKELYFISGKGSGINSSFLGSKNDRSVYAMVSGEIVQVNDRVGGVIIKNDSLELNYMVVDLDSTLQIGSKVNAGDKLGELNQYFGKLKVDLVSGKSNSFYSLVEKACN